MSDQFAPNTDNCSMDPSTSTSDESRELADLRRRAYGPDADIQGDPDAMRRLHELESEARRADPAAAHEPETDEARESAAEAASVTEPVVENHPVESATVPTRRWWRSGVVWAVAGVSLLLGGAIGATALAASTAPSDGPDVTLEALPGVDDQGPGWDEGLKSWGMEPTSVVQYEAYDTIDVMTARASDSARCILLLHQGSIFTAACARGGLDPVLDLGVDEGWPIHFEQPLGPDGVLRFMARADGVDVWARPGPLSLPGLGD
jgi:hypothetical protein